MVLVSPFLTAQILTSLTVNDVNSFKEWNIGTDIEEEVNLLELTWNLDHSWNEWHFDVRENTGQIKLKWKDDPSEWELHADNKTISMRRIFKDDPREWRISDGTITIRKAILVQAKLGHLKEMNESEADLLKLQIGKMKHLVVAPKVMEIPEYSGRRFPAMISGNNILDGRPYTPMGLPEYFAARVTTTLDGCTNPKIVEAVQESSLSRVDVAAKLYGNVDGLAK